MEELQISHLALVLIDSLISGFGRVVHVQGSRGVIFSKEQMCLQIEIMNRNRVNTFGALSVNIALIENAHPYFEFQDEHVGYSLFNFQGSINLFVLKWQHCKALMFTIT